jgi:hypothetical protein
MCVQRYIVARSRDHCCHGCGTKWSWPNWRYYYSTHVVEIQKTMNNLVMGGARTNI